MRLGQRAFRSRGGSPRGLTGLAALVIAGLSALAGLSAFAGLSTGCTVSFSGPTGNNNNDIPPGCGNGVIDLGEACDATDFGGLTCQTAAEGFEFGELACSANCRLDFTGCHSCGNGVIDAGEDCDDGSALAGDGCDARCRIEHGWFCEQEPSKCTTVCGDGLVVPSVEACDDGNNAVGDGCDASCAKESGWACDDGEPSVCALTCGNGEIDAGEVCDDGGAEAQDGCSPSCEEEEGWDCDGVEPSHCEPICGDGLVLGGEGCDDGGVQANDGCDPACAVEAGWTCGSLGTGPCAPLCGDGLVLGAEPCDDGDLLSGDGCSAACEIEPFFACDSAPSQCSCVVYVSQAPVAGARTGESWVKAYDNLRLALQTASTRAPCEVWVAAGTYRAFEGSTGNSFDVRSNVSVYGGFVGTETRRADRDWEANRVILHAAHATLPTQVVRTVVTANNTLAALVDGVTITGARNTTSRGGGVALDGGELTLRHCLIEDNEAQEGGGGLWVRSGRVTLLDVRLVGNRTSGNGGGIRLENASEAVLDSVSLEGNLATDPGGGIHVNSGMLTVRGSQFLSNSALQGGGLRLEQAGFLAENTLFVGNEAGLQGGGGISLSQIGAAPWQIRSCTFYGNVATPGTGYALRIYGGTASLWNSILWGAQDEQIFLVTAATANLDRCDVSQSVSQGSNLNVDPLFVDPVAGDFRLQPGSPCIDAANGTEAPSTDREGSTRWDDPAVANTGTGTPTYADLGCYERQP